MTTQMNSYHFQFGVDSFGEIIEFNELKQSNLRKMAIC